MIEIKDGWTGKEASDQRDVYMLDSDIKHLNIKLQKALAAKAKIQDECEHNHVIGRQCEICEVCGATL
jgi:hypothetical protein